MFFEVYILLATLRQGIDTHRGFYKTLRTHDERIKTRRQTTGELFLGGGGGSPVRLHHIAVEEHCLHSRPHVRLTHCPRRS